MGWRRRLGVGRYIYIIRQYLLNAAILSALSNYSLRKRRPEESEVGGDQAERRAA